MAPGWCYIHFTVPTSIIDSVNIVTESGEKPGLCAYVCVCMRVKDKERERESLVRHVTADRLFCLHT